MRIFWFEIKASKNWLSPSGTGTGVALSTGWVSPDGKAYYENGNIAAWFQTYYYMARINADIVSCIRELDQTAAKGGWYLAKKFQTGNREIPRSETNDMYYAFDAGSGWFDHLKRQIIYNLTVSGNCFIMKRRNEAGKVVGYQVLNTRDVSIRATTDFQIIGYNVRLPKRTQELQLGADDVLHVGMTLDQDDGIFFMSPLESVRLDVLWDEQANRMNYEYFFTSGLPPAIYKFAPGTPERVMQEIIDKVRNQLKWGANKHRVIGTQGIESIEKVSDGGADMQNTERRKYATEKICAVLGVPKVQLGYTEWVNFSNATQQYTKFIENTIRPLEKWLKSVFDTLILEDFAETKIEFLINDTHIDDIEQKSKIAQSNVSQGVWTPNEARQYIGYDIYEDPLADSLFVPSGRMPLEQIPAEIPPEDLTNPV